MRRLIGSRPALAVAALLLLAVNSASAQDRYCLWIFSSQSEPKLPKYAHTWATFAHVADCRGMRTFEAFTISWLPATLNIRTYAVRPEQGVNLDLPATLDYVTSGGERISVWGPYAISAELYGRAIVQRARLQSGVAMYRAIDPFIRRSNISDCIHAVSDIAPSKTRVNYIETVFFGDLAGRHIAHAFQRRGLTCPAAEDLGWLEQALGMTCYRITRRQ